MNLAANLLLAVMMLQSPGRRTRQPAGGAATDVQVAAIATFDGTFKSAGKKYLTIEVESGNTMQFYITGATKFERDGQPAKAASFESGEKVTVEGSRDLRMNLLAVKVSNVRLAKPAEKQ